jgi:phage recombination protein Bet
MSNVIHRAVSRFPLEDKSSPPLPIPDQKIQKDTIIEFLKAFGFDKTLSPAEQNQFLQTALAGNLDPFKREIYIAVYGEGENRKVSILTGYQVYLKRAERTGKLDGWRAWLEGSVPQMKAIVEIFRKDWSHSFTHEVYWEETVQKKKDGNPTQFWAKQPRFQLRKVAIAQGFRLAFPDELGGLPYESAELPDTENTDTTVMPHTPTTSVKTSNPASGVDLAALALKGATPSTPVNPEKAGSPVNKTQAADQQDSDAINDFVDNAVQYIEDLFETHPDEFTEKHQAWILDKVYKAPDKAGVDKMIAYAEKVVRKALPA